MPLVRLGAASLNQTPLDWKGNALRITAAIDAARDAGVGLLCLPELAVSGYGCEDAFFAPHIRQRAVRELLELAPATHGLAVAVGVPLEVEGRLYNGAAMLADGRLLGVTLKRFLADDGIHYEPRWFKPWPTGRVAALQLGGAATPVGDLAYRLAGVGVGFEVCRDAWVEDRPAKRMPGAGVGVILNPSASHFAFGKQAIRERLVRDGSKLIDGAYVYCNLLGNESGRAVYDGGTLLADRGELVLSGRRFSYRDRTLTFADLEVPESDAVASDDRVVDPYDPSAPPKPSDTATVLTEKPTEGREPKQSALEEFSHAVPLGMFDYLRKSGAQGFVLSLSGGADSAATAMMVALMARQGIEELGTNGFAERLSRVPGLVGLAKGVDIADGAKAADSRGAVERLLTTVYQATRNSSDTTRDAAAEVARTVGAEHHAWSVDDLVERYVELGGEAIGRPLAWETDDLALQNIQSRVRSPGVWLLANLKNALLLTTGNRSEAAVGYATMDGDTSGGLAPLAGVDKAFLLEWLRWMESDGPADFGPTPGLSVINAQQPTAELRPPADGQTDEADLMPYPVLAAIERSAIGELDPPETTLAKLREEFPVYDEPQLRAWLDRFAHLWRVSQWKRERLAPALHLDTLSVDPKTWRRWPILSGDGV